MCKPKVVAISQEEYKALYEAEQELFYQQMASGVVGFSEIVNPWFSQKVKIDPTIAEKPRKSEMIRELCQAEHDKWVELRWGNFRKAVAAIRVDNWPVRVGPLQTLDRAEAAQP